MNEPKPTRQSCDQCNVLYINGVRCHESGCPSAWRDYDVSCFECGTDFRPDERHQTVCEDCLHSEINDREFDDMAENGTDYEDLEAASDFMRHLESQQSEPIIGRSWPQ